jgi:hypothetical protein
MPVQFCPLFYIEVKLGPVKLREKRKLRVFKDSVPRITFRFFMDEVMGDWQEVYDRELQNLQSSQYIIRLIEPRMRWMWRVLGRQVHSGFQWGEPEGKTPLGKTSALMGE